MLPDVVDPADRSTALVADLDDLEAKVDEFLAAQEDGRFDIAESGAITFTLHAVLRSEAARRFARHPALVGLCRDLLGPDVNLYWDQAVYKKPEKPRRFPWHQDTGYTFVEPQHYLTCWVALTDATVDNGCPRVLPAVHREGTLLHRWVDPIGWQCVEGDPADAVTVEVPAGGVVAFSSLTPHCTGPNTTDGVRKAYIVQYGPDGMRAVDGDWQHGVAPTRSSQPATTPTASSPCSAAASPSERASPAQTCASGRLTVNEAPPPGASPTTTVPWWAATTCATIASPRPAPPTPRARASSSRVKRSKTRVRSAAGTPGPSSRTTSTTCPFQLVELEADGAAGVALGVVGQVPHHATELTGVASHLAGRDPSAVDLHMGPPAQPCGLFQHDVVEVDRLAGRPAGELLGPGQQQEVVDQALHPQALGQQPLVDRPDVRAVGIGDLQLEPVADGRERAAQLVTGVRDEPLLATPGRLEPAEHLVHRPGQPARPRRRRGARAPDGRAGRR